MSSYHGWTHRPKAQGGTDPISSTADPITITQFAINTYAVGPVPAMTIPDNTLTVLEWEQNTNSATEPGQGSLGSTDNFATAGSEQTTHDPDAHTTDMWLYRSGVFLVGCAVLWEAGDYPKQTQLQEVLGAAGSNSSFFGKIHSVSPFFATSPIASMLLAENPVTPSVGLVHQHIDMWALPAAGSDVTDCHFRIEVLQTSGSDKVINAANLAVVRLGEFVTAA